MCDEIERDYFQDVATCSFGDMLWDKERNLKFKIALGKAIKKRKLEGKSTHVLDIGTGTGLLAMMAAEEGADSVIACEMFKPVAICARNIIEQNGFGDRIKVLIKKSTELRVGADGDIPFKIDILVSEVFDTELIGEGAIETFNHAHAYILKQDAIVIPSVGTVYCQLIESETLLNWNRLNKWMDDGKTLVEVPDNIRTCPGQPSLFDIQLSQLPRHQFKCLSDPFPLFKFQFMHDKNIPREEMSCFKSTSICEGRAQMVFMWWELVMDDDDQVLLSCAPVWAHPQAKEDEGCNMRSNIPWRDHWMQAVYFLPMAKDMVKDETYTIRGWHDEFSFWFSLCPCSNNEVQCSCKEESMPMCRCGLHLLASRTRLASLNDPFRRQAYTGAIKKLLTKTKKFILLGDLGLLAFVLVALGAERVEILIQDSSYWVEHVFRSFPMFHGDKISLHYDLKSIALDKLVGPVCIFSEPFSNSSLLPMDNLRLFELKNRIVNYLKQNQEREIFVFPQSAAIKCVSVVFDDLWKINRPLVSCEGFKMKFFDDLIATAKARVQNQVEPQPLWEYPCQAVSNPKTLFTLNFHSSPTETYEHDEVIHVFSRDENVDGVAFWVDYSYEGVSLSTGPLCPIVKGSSITWNQCDRQGVYIFPRQLSQNNGDKLIKCSFRFNFESASYNIIFNEL